MKANPPHIPVRFTRKEFLQHAAGRLEVAIATMKQAGYGPADTALTLTEQALRQLREDIQVTED